MISNIKNLRFQKIKNKNIVYVPYQGVQLSKIYFRASVKISVKLIDNVES